jgi:iron complex transport system ATP-binding protein
MISVRGLSHEIGNAAILNDIDVDIPKGGVTALIGPNGAGKSTLLNLVARQQPVQTGRVVLDGQDIAQMKHRDLALRMAVVAQNVGVASRLRIRDLVGFGRWPHAQGRPTPQDGELVECAIVQFDLTTFADRFLDEVSGGQRQRAFLAMAYAQDTDWLLLDEPLNNLDLRYARDLMAELHTLAHNEGKSIVIVLHDLNYAISWADRIIAMKQGRIVFEGDTMAVATSAALSDLYDTEVIVDNSGASPFIRHHD